MLAGVSHDLKTPLTRMKLQLAMMDDSADKQAMIQDIDDMETMIAGYLSFAKGDGGEAMQRISLSDVLNKVIEDAERLSLKVIDECHKAGDLTIWAKPNSLSRAFDNFIANAARYADIIKISCFQNSENIMISVEDNGPGIPDDRLDDMMKPFVRGDESRNTKTGGVGLGLTIANDIITSIGGSITLQKSDELGGLKVKVMLPL
jgi:two-component system osmolarity sensor histidine kinase EnvZ